MAYCKKCGAKLPVDARYCPACGTRVISEKTEEIHRVLKITDKPNVIVINLSPGSIEAEHGTQQKVTIDLDLRYPEDLDYNIVQEENVITVTCRMRSSLWKWPSYMFGTGPRANISISVPTEADLDLENRAGLLKVIGIKGSIAARSSAGKITMRDCEGAIKANTKAGSINLKNVNGTVSVRSSAGSIRFNGALSKGDNWFRTSVGSINIRLQGEPDLAVEASTSLGSIRCVPELTDARYEGNRRIGRVGAGTGRLVAETKTGSITIHH